MRKKIIVLFILLLTLAAAFMHSISFLTIRSNEQLVWMFPVTDHSTFSLRWVHSVEQEEWEEFFRITDHSIYVDSTRFKTFGAGVPNQAGKASYLKDGWLYMVGIDRKIDDLHVRAGSTTNHRLYMKGKVYTLSVEDEQKPYHFMIENIPIYRYLTHLLLTKFQR